MAHSSNYRKHRKLTMPKVTIHTGGKKVDGLRFQGEMMTCVMCGKTKQSDPAVESDWTFLEIEGKSGYVCHDELAAAHAGKEPYSDAYYRILKKILGLEEGQTNG
jgi:hypothetical protein